MFKKTNRMKELDIVQVPYSRVRSYEYPGLMNDVVVVVSKHSAVTYYVVGQFNILLDVQVKLNDLEAYYRKLPKTEELNLLRAKRNTMIAGTLKQTKVLRQMNMASQVEALNVVTPFLEQYLNAVKNGRTVMKRERIRQLGKSFDDNTALQDALELLGLKLFIDELRTVQNSIDLALSEQVELLANIPYLDTKLIISNSIAALKNMFSAIQLAKLEHPALDYSPLITELNIYLTFFNAKLKMRITIQKNALAAKKLAAKKTATDPTATSDSVAE